MVMFDNPVVIPAFPDSFGGFGELVGGTVVMVAVVVGSVAEDRAVGDAVTTVGPSVLGRCGRSRRRRVVVVVFVGSDVVVMLLLLL